jgi:hypothetical protein
MHIVPHHTKKVKVLSFAADAKITPGDIIQMARRSEIIDGPEKGRNALVWIRFGASASVPYRVGFLHDCVIEKAVMTAEGWVFAEDLV